MNDTDKDHVLARVRKLLALGNDPAAAEGERDNAMRMAHATLAKYNLSLGDAEVKEDARINSPIKMCYHAWARQAAFGIAKLYFCSYFIIPNKNTGSGLHVFVGRESNVKTAQEMSKFVIASINKEAHQRAKLVGQGATWERSFAKGAASAVWFRCKEIRATAEKAEQQQQPASGAGTSLVLASLYKQELDRNNALIKEQHGDLGKAKGKQRNTDFGAHSAGKEFGKNISLNTQVGASGASYAQKDRLLRAA